MPADAEGAGVAPVDPDRPFVDGTRTSSDDLRAEVDALTVDGRTGDKRVEELRADVAGTVVELSARLDRGRARRAALAKRLALGAAAAVSVFLVLRRRGAARRRNGKMP